MAQILGFCVTCGVKMMSLHHGWGWQPPQTTSHIHIRHAKCLSTFICCLWAYGSSLKQLYPHYLGNILEFWVTCRVKMMSFTSWLRLTANSTTASHIHIKQIQSFWAHSYAVHGHTAAALNSYNTLLGLDFGVLGHLWTQNDVITSWCSRPVGHLQ